MSGLVRRSPEPVAESKLLWSRDWPVKRLPPLSPEVAAARQDARVLRARSAAMVLALVQRDEALMEMAAAGLRWRFLEKPPAVRAVPDTA